MATRASIEFDFRKAMNQAERIDEIANGLSHLSQNRFDQTMQGLAANWKGDSAARYLAKGSRLQKSMGETANELRDIASDIRKIAKALYDAEIAALIIARQRDY